MLVLVLEPVLAALPLVRARAVQVAVTSSAHSPAQEAVGVVQLAPVCVGALLLLHVPLCAFGHTLPLAYAGQILSFRTDSWPPSRACGSLFSFCFRSELSLQAWRPVRLWAQLQCWLQRQWGERWQECNGMVRAHPRTWIAWRRLSLYCIPAVVPGLLCAGFPLKPVCLHHHGDCCAVVPFSLCRSALT